MRGGDGHQRQQRIAARFGVSEATVEKRLKLGRVAPAILDAYRAGDIGLEQVQVFAISDDRKAQQRVFAACNGNRAARCRRLYRLGEPDRQRVVQERRGGMLLQRGGNHR